MYVYICIYMYMYGEAKMHLVAFATANAQTPSRPAPPPTPRAPPGLRHPLPPRASARAPRPDTAHPPVRGPNPSPPTPLPSIWVRLVWPTAIDRQIATFCVTSCTDYSYPIATLSDDFEKGASGQNK